MSSNPNTVVFFLAQLLGLEIQCESLSLKLKTMITMLQSPRTAIKSLPFEGIFSAS